MTWKSKGFSCSNFSWSWFRLRHYAVMIIMISCLQVTRPYWLADGGRDAKVVGSSGIRATWLGHASVLAEVDSTVVITDPIFSQRASPVSFSVGSTMIV